MFPLQFRSAEELPLGARLLAFGCRGADVRALQLALQAIGFGLEADGVYGYVTETVVRRFQIRFGLAPDGVAGRETLARLEAVRAGYAYAFHRARPGETAAGIAKFLGVREEALRRWNGLRRGEAIPPGRLLAVPRLAILLLPGEKPPACLASTLTMGPRLDLLRPQWPADEEYGPGCLPVMAADEAAWREFLDRSSGRRQTAGFLRDLARSRGVRAVVVEIPSRLWRRRRRLLAVLAHLCDDGGPAVCPLVYWSEAGAARPDLPGLARFSARFLLDPGSSVFDLGSLARILRWACAAVPANRLLVVLRGGGLLSEGGVEKILSTRGARAEAVAARARWVWDEAAGAIRAVAGREEKPEWRLFLLEERGLRLRVRLAARLGLSGVALGGLSGLVRQRWIEGPWPGEFAVVDNFLLAPHID